MNKLNMHTQNQVDINIRRIGELFPNALTERKNDKGEVERAIDFDVLRQELSQVLVEGHQERYQFTWPDKRKAQLLANAPISDTLRPCREESVDFDSTENLYIEGDNLNVLKLLQETYLGKVKMIYIDPPYNTGNDSFVYDDEFDMDSAEFSSASKQFEDGKMMFDIRQNNEANGRYHTDWLNMMYPRLRLAKDLLSDNGIILISIDDNEVTNLRKMCDEVFGVMNHIVTFTREAIRGGSQSNDVRRVHDYVVCYVKNKSFASFSGFKEEGVVLDQVDEKGPFRKGRELNKWGAASRREDSPSMFFPIDGPNGEDVFPIRNDGSEGRWRLGKVKMHKKVSSGDVIFESRGDGTYIVYDKIRESNDRIRQLTSILSMEYVNAKGTESIKKLFEKERAIFDYSKPVELVHDLLIFSDTKEDEIVLDFFSGSATTAHAVMQLNAEDGGKRKFIMVQLPEETEEKSEAYKAGYKNICEIGKERIRRAGAKIKEELEKQNQQLKLGEEPKALPDTGFRVLKLDSSNMKDVYYAPQDYTPTLIDDLIDNIKDDRTPQDLLFQVMLELGVLLSSSIVESDIGGQKVFSVAGGFLMACFDSKINEDTITHIAKQKPHYAVFRDSGYASDSVAVNFDQIFRAHSPDTVRRVL